MHPRDHLLLSTVAAVAGYPLLGKRVAIAWAASVLADIDHAPAFVGAHGLAAPSTVWRYYRGGQAARQRHWLHRWPLILLGLSLARPFPLIGWLAGGLAFHRVLDDLHSLLHAPWRGWKWRLSAKGRQHARLHRRDRYTCRVCGATGKLLELHSVVLENQAGRRVDSQNLISVCVPCHRRLHGQQAPPLVRSV